MISPGKSKLENLVAKMLTPGHFLGYSWKFWGIADVAKYRSVGGEGLRPILNGAGTGGGSIVSSILQEIQV